MTGKTLKELNVQVGDVVRPVGMMHTGIIIENGIEWIVKLFHDGIYYGVQSHYKSTHSGIPLSNSHLWVISRAKKYTAWQFTPAPKNAETHTMPDGAVAWRFVVEPVVKEVTKMLLWGNSDCYVFSFNTIDGVPDCASVKMELLP